MKKDIIKASIIIALDLLLLVLFIAFVPYLLISTVGFDVTEYENWDGALASSVEYTFGAGCWEITIILLKLAAFLVVQGILFVKKKLPKAVSIFCILSHIIVFALGIAYVFEFAEGPNALYMIYSVIGEKMAGLI